MKTAVTGAAGFVGSHLVERLLDDGHEVVALDRPGARYPDELIGREGLTVGELDIRDESDLGTSAATGCEIIFHLAAMVGVTNYLSNPFDVIDVNVLGTRNVLRWAERYGWRVLLSSTSEVYGKNPKVPWAEDEDRVLGGTQVDRWSYSTSKAAAEHLALAAHRSLGVPVTIVRYFNAYGPRQAPIYVLSQSIHRVLNGKPPLIYDSGEQTRCFTYVADIVDGTIAAATSDAAVGEVFNLGNTTEWSIREAIALVIDEGGGPADMEDFRTGERFGASYQDIVRRVPDVSKARNLLGWEAAIGLRDGVALTIEWAKDHASWLNDSRASEPSTASSGL